MLVVKNKTVWFDVDDTLVLWDTTSKLGKKIKLKGETNDGKPFTMEVVAHKEHIEEIKRYKMRGFTVIVWSQGGGEWGEKVINTLGLKGFVDIVIGKIDFCYDNWHPRIWCPEPIFKNGDNNPDNPTSKLEE
jgi:FMN phosphatase YigB (HAD superfamily)